MLFVAKKPLLTLIIAHMLIFVKPPSVIYSIFSPASPAGSSIIALQQKIPSLRLLNLNFSRKDRSSVGVLFKIKDSRFSS